MRDTLYTKIASENFAIAYIKERMFIMTLEAAEKLKTQMPWKQIYFDIANECYRLIDPNEFYEYEDEEGKLHKRTAANHKALIPIN
jgi:hypothetical protein